MHTTLKERKGRPFTIVDQGEYDFNTREGNILYCGLNEVYKEYKSQTIMNIESEKILNEYGKYRLTDHAGRFFM